MPLSPSRSGSDSSFCKSWVKVAQNAPVDERGRGSLSCTRRRHSFSGPGRACVAGAATTILFARERRYRARRAGLCRIHDLKQRPPARFRIRVFRFGGQGGEQALILPQATLAVLHGSARIQFSDCLRLRCRSSAACLPDRRAPRRSPPASSSQRSR